MSVRESTTIFFSTICPSCSSQVITSVWEKSPNPAVRDCGDWPRSGLMAPQRQFNTEARTH